MDNIELTRLYGLYDDDKGTHQAGSVYEENGLSPCLDVCGGGNRMPMIRKENQNMAKRLRIRKLTEEECMRLMGFERCDSKAMKDAGLSKSAIYHVAGDSICVSCLMSLFSVLLGITGKERIEEYADKLADENGKAFKEEV